MPIRYASLSRHALAAAILTAVVAGCGGGRGTPMGAIDSPAAATNPAAPASVPAPGADGSAAAPTPPSTPGGPTMEPSTPAPTPTLSRGSFTLTSTAFDDGEAIPREATCDGADRSPALAWTGVPDSAAALVLFLDDPDARDFVHWTVLDLPVDPSGSGALPAGVPTDAATPQQGRNDFRRVGYGGPCPPAGTHRYRFRLYALAAPLGLDGHPTGDQVRAALDRAQVLGRAELTGRYERR